MENIGVRQPTKAELEILRVLWQEGEATVKTINTKLNEHKRVGYTTTLKIMQVMTDKKMLERKIQGRSHLYRPVFKKEEVQGLLVDRLLESAFGGSAKNLVMQALGNRHTSKQELAEIKAFLAEIEKES